MGGQPLEPMNATIYFCEPWGRLVPTIGEAASGADVAEEPRLFGVLGLAGGLDQLKLTVWAHLKHFQLERADFDQLS
jgi:hypothetical protein